MKIIYSFIFFNLFIVTISSNVIYDSSGNKLLRGIPYYIIPLLRGSGGGLTLTQTKKNTCPLNVTQEPFDVNHGVPFIFNPIILDEDIIHGAYPISIEADVTNACSGSTIWKFNKPESCFQFVENDMMPGLQSYQIQHCPFKCGSSSTDVGCYNVGIISNPDGNGYLGRTDSIFPVVFINSFGTLSSQSGKVSTFSQLAARVNKFSHFAKVL
ncbi:proteinase inhibitor I3 [Artemisia annua]|uniref:Proteinase inhibitor I3 n=1 Tax=Artemisia annua TaxID=35608 RepID=A0A2U1NDB4_ARTAN|nr:proteinase inhibitor I3 [Artemisia annua]